MSGGYKHKDNLKQWMATGRNRYYIQSEFPKEATKLNDLTHKLSESLCKITHCGSKPAEINELVVFLAAEGIIHFDGTYVKTLR